MHSKHVTSGHISATLHHAAPFRGPAVLQVVAAPGFAKYFRTVLPSKPVTASIPHTDTPLVLALQCDSPLHSVTVTAWGIFRSQCWGIIAPAVTNSPVRRDPLSKLTEAPVRTEPFIPNRRRPDNKNSVFDNSNVAQSGVETSGRTSVVVLVANFNTRSMSDDLPQSRDRLQFAPILPDDSTHGCGPTPTTARGDERMHATLVNLEQALGAERIDMIARDAAVWASKRLIPSGVAEEEPVYPCVQPDGIPVFRIEHGESSPPFV